MVKKVLIMVLNTVIYTLCVLFSLSSFFCMLSFTSIEKKAFQNGTVMIVIFVTGIAVSFIAAHFLNRIIIFLRLPIEEWKNHLLK